VRVCKWNSVKPGLEITMEYTTYVEPEAVVELEGAVDVADAIAELVRVTPYEHSPQHMNSAMQFAK